MNSVQLVAAALCLLEVAEASTAVLAPSRAAMLLATVSASATRSVSDTEQATRTGMASVSALLQILTASLQSLKESVTYLSISLMTQPFRPSLISARASLSQHSQAAAGSEFKSKHFSTSDTSPSTIGLHTSISVWLYSGGAHAVSIFVWHLDRVATRASSSVAFPAGQLAPAATRSSKVSLYSDALLNLFAILGSLPWSLFSCLKKLLAFFENPL